MIPFKVAVDIEGGDFAPGEIIRGVLNFPRSANREVVIVASEEIIKPYAEEYSCVYASDTPPTEESPTEAIRKKRNSSLFVSLDLLKEKKVDAVITAGNTGHLLVGATLIVGRLKNVERPALGVFLPTLSGGKNFIIDVGANPDIKPQHLTGLAVLSQLFLEISTGKADLEVTLLSNGTEESKGNFFTKEAFKYLSEIPNFKGYVEGLSLFSDPEKVILTDGFTGNIVLKSLEALGGYLKQKLISIDSNVTNRIKTTLGLFLLKSHLRKILKSLDYSEYGGAPLFGINGLCIKAHGRSKAKSITRAIEVAFSLLENEYLTKVKNRLEQMVP
ncbi:MAG: Phosphate acyltransferase [candidate division WS2 bacterium]|nr:Phosphate acyltransferase [Candidatus Psychracetigena formicireducens]